jgi:hypothetical protein
MPEFISVTTNDFLSLIRIKEKAGGCHSFCGQSPQGFFLAPSHGHQRQCSWIHSYRPFHALFIILGTHANHYISCCEMQINDFLWSLCKLIWKRCTEASLPQHVAIEFSLRASCWYMHVIALRFFSSRMRRLLISASDNRAILFGSKPSLKGVTESINMNNQLPWLI